MLSSPFTAVFKKHLGREEFYIKGAVVLHENENVRFHGSFTFLLLLPTLPSIYRGCQKTYTF